MNIRRAINANTIHQIISALVILGLLFSMYLKEAHAKETSTSNSQATIDTKQQPYEEDYYSARVIRVGAKSTNQDLLESTGIVSTRQPIQVEVTDGPLKGKSLNLNNEISDNPAFNIVPKVGQEVILAVSGTNSKDREFFLADYKRSTVLLILFIAFISTFLFFGGKQGLKSLFGLTCCALLILYVLLPASMAGFSPLLTAAFIAALSTIISVLSVAGFSKKSLSAIGGTIGGVIIAGLASYWTIEYAPLTGLSSEEAQILRGSVLMQSPRFYQGLLAASMLIGALGVIMDVAVSIASSVFEVSTHKSDLSFSQLFSSGMNVGKDIMGTMTNTLVLAYAGGALPLLLLASQMNPAKLINLDLFATEIAAALTGSLGLVCTIPLTSYFAAKLASFANEASSSNKSVNNLQENTKLLEGN